MKALERRGLTALHVVVAATGFVYLYMQHFVETDDPFAIVNHPAQPLILALHVVAAPAFVLFFGMIYRHHIWRKLRGRDSTPNIWDEFAPASFRAWRKRRGRDSTGRGTGWFLLVGFFAMVLSAYLLQVATAPAAIQILYWTHVVAGSVFAVAYLWHFVIGWPLGRARRKRIKEMTSGRARSR